MKRIIKLDATLIPANSFRAKLKTGLARCKPEAQAYHACVTIRFL
jgi:hypothetical protein